MFSDSDGEKMLDSPALESDSDEGIPSRPPTPSFPTRKSEDNKALSQSKVVKVEKSLIKAEQAPEVKQKPKQDEVRIKGGSECRENTQDLFNDSSDEDMLSNESRSKGKKERDRHISAHDRQKESEKI